MKRKFSDYQCSNKISQSTRSKKPCLIRPILEYKNKEDLKDYISASQVINFIQDDCLLDWLKLRKEINEDRESTYLTSQGNLFELKVVKFIHDNIYPVIKVSDPKDYSFKNVEITLDLMKKGIPIIYSAPLRSKNYKLYGTADLLVRNDYLTKIFSDFQGEENENKKIDTIFSHSYYYTVIDIKWCTLQLGADGKTLLNVERFPGYKGQLTVYNRCLGEMQGYYPNQAYILGRKYIYISKGKKNFSFSPFVRPGVYSTTDIKINQKVDQAIIWLKELNKFGNIWTVNPPSRIELYPNLGNKYYYNQKRELAEEIGDLSLIMGIKSEKRRKAFQHGIYSIHDNRLNSQILGIQGKTGSMMDKILKTNHQDREMILPLKIRDNYYGWKDNVDEIFVDFEKFTDIIDDFKDITNHKPLDIIFLIGIGYLDKDKEWKYIKLIGSSPDLKGEEKLLKEFLEIVKCLNNPKIWYYFAEERFWQSALGRHPSISSDLADLKLKWRDCRNILIKEEITFKYCYDYKLKSVISALNKCGLSTLKNNSECDDGFQAMLDGWNYYQTGDVSLINKICKYNEFDVKAIYEILRVLRDNYLKKNN